MKTKNNNTTQKKEPTLLRLVAVMTGISLAAALALTGVYAITREPIDMARQAKKQEAIKLVLPDFTGTLQDTAIVLDKDKDPFRVHLAMEDNRLAGAAIEAYTEKAFKGRFDIMVGFDSAGVILNTEVITANETPGLGDKINKGKSSFAGQFNYKNPTDFVLKVKKDGGGVDAITAATISSRAYCDAVQKAYDIFMKIKEDYK